MPKSKRNMIIKTDAGYDIKSVALCQPGN